MEQAYATAHDAVWPSLIAAQREVGIGGWWIFRSGLDLLLASSERAGAPARRAPVSTAARRGA